MSRDTSPQTALAISLLLLLVACGDAGTGPVPSDPLAEIAGSWTATRIEFTSRANPSRTVDFADLGGDLVLDIAADGTFTGSLDVPDIATGERVHQSLSGQIEAVGSSSLMVQFDAAVGLGADTAASWTVDYTEAGNTMTWTRPDASYDFDVDLPQPAEPAELTLAFSRTG